jgi:selenide, water dikinase
MSVMEEPIRLTALSHGAGCACKLSLDELTGVLGRLGWPEHPDLLVGVTTGDDAAVWRRPGGQVLVATTDFFTPLVDDPHTWGRIAAANAVSDVYAMGATPLFGLNLVGWPRALPFDLLEQVLVGAATVAEAAGYPVVGGHSIDSQEPLYGQVVIGEASQDRLLTNAGGLPGQHVVLTKPIGTGIVTTALKRSEAKEATGDTALATAYRAAVGSMTRLNDVAARVGGEVGATAATDVTGFGLLGHLHRLTKASDLACEVDAAAVPLLPGIETLVDDGFVPGGTTRNTDQAAAFLRGSVDERTATLLCDAQTSGGLLLCCEPAAAAAAVDVLVAAGHHAAVVAELHAGDAGTIEVSGRAGRSSSEAAVPGAAGR